MANILDIGISGLRAQQTALTVTGNNITNAGTEGYSRQQVSFTENDPQYNGNWIGSGVNVDSVRRVYDEFLTEQLRRDTTTFESFNALAVNAGQINSLLADSGTGVQPGLETMFGAMQAAVDDPSSLPAREVLISEANGLSDRFTIISDRLTEQNKIINGQMDVIASSISTIAESIAELNEQIQFASAGA
ncbi:MAG: flagellar basal body protein, partial [Oleibacter sp.]|nr:flagellar basal body protein [Thalassolituus sp.]